MNGVEGHPRTVTEVGDDDHGPWWRAEKNLGGRWSMTAPSKSARVVLIHSPSFFKKKLTNFHYLNKF